MSRVRAHRVRSRMQRWKRRSRKTLESLPSAATHLSTRSLAEKVGLSQSAVVRIGIVLVSRTGPRRSSCPQILILVEKVRYYRGSVFESSGTCDRS